jgi:purine-binding chemotaxis protein CheW
MNDEKRTSRSSEAAIDREVNRRAQQDRAASGEALEPSTEEKRRILKARAQELALESGDESASEETVEVVELLLAQEKYGIESGYVREVYPLKEITKLPGTPPFILGITNVRGRIIAVNDLRRFFGLQEMERKENSKVVILCHDRMELGVLVDEIVGVRSIPLAEIQSPLPAQAAVCAEHMRGVTGDRMVLLDAARILSDERMIVHEEVEV